LDSTPSAPLGPGGGDEVVRGLHGVHDETLCLHLASEDHVGGEGVVERDVDRSRARRGDGELDDLDPLRERFEHPSKTADDDLVVVHECHGERPVSLHASTVSPETRFR
jgi:hypothetical protein